jgi:hypothetical protein
MWAFLRSHLCYLRILRLGTLVTLANRTQVGSVMLNVLQSNKRLQSMPI